MVSLENVTILILTHERQDYLERALEYYTGYSLKIVVADSSSMPFKMIPNYSSVEYLHFQGKTHGQKLSEVLTLIGTRYTVMCADDDFTIPDAIETCIEFLEKNTTYAVAQGNSVSYKKETEYPGGPVLNVMYPGQYSFVINQDTPFDRIAGLFHNYRTIFCAVHHTQYLRLAYGGINDRFTNLFLNEYLSAIIPLIAGKHIELPVFFQVREYTHISGDKTTDNLDVIYTEGRYSTELNNYLEYTADIISHMITMDKETCKQALNDILSVFAEKLAAQKSMYVSVTFLKRAGKIISHVPFIGKKIILYHRSISRKKQVSGILRTKQDIVNLHVINRLILKYAARLSGI